MIIDTNVNLSRWPFRRLPCDAPEQLVAKLAAFGITQAWAGSLDGLFHKDVAGVNRRLADDCAKHGPGLLVPFGTVNPTLPDWQDDLCRCQEDHGMRGVRLHPNYHGYGLDDPAFVELLSLAEKRGLIVQLALRMEDLRTQHRFVQVGDVDVAPLVELVSTRPGLRLVLLNALRTLRSNSLEPLAAAGNVWFEISMQEGVGGVGNLMRTVSADRVVFGSHLPLFLLESAVLKLRESDLSAEEIRAVTHANAQRLLSG